MHRIFICLVVVFSVLMTGIHAPAAAHVDNIAAHHESDAVHNHAPYSHDRADETGGAPMDVGSDVLHHHHCPVGLANVSAHELIASLITSAAPVAPDTAILPSHATAPPLQPPLA